ncbi:hypothetical protein AOQ84DRAFT_435816 [Glonium stellatum]|uniref:C3H1-type domain-containing protein n=1 Tax=Glonium stellatum TaxID=574774 RepID=A0A8E2JYU7_9PEZI|nr:hypothetical protein AOQ84DRAFT_435816 [Glonium stellatum]
MGGTRYIGWEALMPCKHLNTPQGCYREDCPFSHNESLLQSCFKQACKHLASPEGCPLGEECPFSHKLSSSTEPRTLEQGKSKSPHLATRNTTLASGARQRDHPFTIAKKKYVNIVSSHPPTTPTTAHQLGPASNETQASRELHEPTDSQRIIQAQNSRVSLILSNNTTSHHHRSSGNAAASSSEMRLSQSASQSSVLPSSLQLTASDTPASNPSRRDNVPSTMHNVTSESTSSLVMRSRPAAASPLSAAELSVRKWKYHTMDHSLTRPLGRFVSQWFQGLQLITADSGVMQEAITCLASNGGLHRIKELLSRDFDELPIEYQMHLFTSQILPFFQIIIQPDVLASGVLEHSVGVISNFLFEPNGQRATGLFKYIVEMLDNLPIQSIEISLAVLSKVVDLNGAAALQHEFLHILLAFKDIIIQSTFDKNDSQTNRTKRTLARTEQRLKIGLSLPTAAEVKRIPRFKASFEIIKDLPGTLSEDGPRHDNDSEDIRQIKIMPTIEEIQSIRIEYLPSNDPTEWHTSGTEGLLDRNFRLLREDTVGQLRDSVRTELEKLQYPETKTNIRKRTQNRTRTNIYRNVTFEDILVDKWKGMEFVIGMEQPSFLHSMSAKRRAEWWGNSRCLQRESLVCILDGAGFAIFCSISELRQTPKMAHGSDWEGSRPKPSVPSRAYIILRLVNSDEPNVKWFLQRHQRGLSFQLTTMVEFPHVLLPSFLPTLQGLQRITEMDDLPFSELLAASSQSASPVHISPPLYALESGFRFDLSCITTENQNLTLSPNEPFDIDALRSSSTLDDAQAVALVEALSRRLALIQGPPGPILCVCYTNHALDQMLEHLIANGVRQIVRIGSRSKLVALADVNIRVISEKMDRTRTEKHRYWQLTSELIKDAVILLDWSQFGLDWTGARLLTFIGNPSSFEIVLDERDEQQLEKDGIYLEDIPRITKTTLLQTLKVATIDNFQGEEAKVVVISLVRGNDKNNCGFLKTSNRINVLLSRTQHRMYILGNSSTASSVPIVQDIPTSRATSLRQTISSNFIQKVAATGNAPSG